MTRTPLCVGLVGGLLPNSPVSEAALSLMKHSPSAVVQLPIWRLRGREVLAREVAARADVTTEGLPYPAGVRAEIDAARGAGRPVILATTTARAFADPIAADLGVFDEVVVADDGAALGRALVERFGEGAFDFVGGPREVAALRPSAREVHGPAAGDTPSPWTVLRRTLRVHQWLKNLLIFLPVLAGQRFTEAPVLGAAALAFVAFSLTASSVYVVNDVLDLREDRRHPTKRNRPFARGDLRLSRAPWLLALLLGVAGVITMLLPPAFRLVLGIYLLLTFAYSLRLKGAVLVDVVTLAGLYTLRIIAGSAATGIQPSVWLLGFSLFFFLSLALVKRYAELHETMAAHEGGDGARHLPGRGYQPRDLPVLISLGVATGCVAVLVLALYVISDEFARHYRYPVLLWQLCPLALYWIGRAWIVVARDEMVDDPVVWAVRDQLSRWVAIVAILVLILAR